MSAVDDVQSYLAAATLIDGATGWTSSRRRVHDDTDQLVTITEDGGLPPELPSAEGVGEASIRDQGVQVRVRAAAWQGDAARAKAEAIYQALHGLFDTTLGATTYDRVRALTEPLFLGFDENSRPDFTTSFRLMEIG